MKKMSKHSTRPSYLWLYVPMYICRRVGMDEVNGFADVAEAPERLPESPSPRSIGRQLAVESVAKTPSCCKWKQQKGHSATAIFLLKGEIQHSNNILVLEAFQGGYFVLHRLLQFARLHIHLLDCEKFSCLARMSLVNEAEGSFPQHSTQSDLSSAIESDGSATHELTDT